MLSPTGNATVVGADMSTCNVPRPPYLSQPVLLVWIVCPTCIACLAPQWAKEQCNRLDTGGRGVCVMAVVCAALIAPPPMGTSTRHLAVCQALPPLVQTATDSRWSTCAATPTRLQYNTIHCVMEEPPLGTSG
jgi:hypothetical protein